jgi:hypothetical protein
MKTIKVIFVYNCAHKIKGMLLSGFSTHGYKSLNKPLEGLRRITEKPAGKNGSNFLL